MTSQLTIIHIRLLDEGVDVWRPVYASQVGANEFVIRGVQHADVLGEVPDDETWEFQPGDRVRCDDGLIAIELVDAR